MAAASKMDNSELITELLQALTNDVKAIGQAVKKAPTDPAVDYGPRFDALTRAVEALPDRLKPAPASPDLRAFADQLNRIEHDGRQHPAYKASQYVQIGAIASGVMVVLLVITSWKALGWQEERDQYARNYTLVNWRLRYLKQAEPEYHQLIEAQFEKDADGTGRWIEKQEQADATREAAQKAAEQAAVLTKQANQLEGTKRKPNS